MLARGATPHIFAEHQLDGMIQHVSTRAGRAEFRLRSRRLGVQVSPGALETENPAVGIQGCRQTTSLRIFHWLSGITGNLEQLESAGSSCVRLGERGAAMTAFLSYAHQDDDLIAALRRALEDMGYSVWLDLARWPGLVGRDPASGSRLRSIRACGQPPLARL